MPSSYHKISRWEGAKANNYEGFIDNLVALGGEFFRDAAALDDLTLSGLLHRAWSVIKRDGDVGHGGALVVLIHQDQLRPVHGRRVWDCAVEPRFSFGFRRHGIV